MRILFIAAILITDRRRYGKIMTDARKISMTHTTGNQNKKAKGNSKRRSDFKSVMVYTFDPE
jgi:hypothetical protein